MISSCGSYDEDHHLLADNTFLASLLVRSITAIRPFQKEDIKRYNLLHDLCNQIFYLAEQRFRYLTDVDPTSLISIDNDGDLPLHVAAQDVDSIKLF